MSDAEPAAATPAATPPKRGWARWLVVLIPYAWSLLFFLIPFLIVFKISFSTSAIAQPPYTPVFSLIDGIGGPIDSARQFSFDNYVYLTQDSLYVPAYLSSPAIAIVLTFLGPLLGFPTPSRLA